MSHDITLDQENESSNSSNDDDDDEDIGFIETKDILRNLSLNNDNNNNNNNNNNSADRTGASTSTNTGTNSFNKPNGFHQRTTSVTNKTIDQINIKNLIRNHYLMYLIYKSNILLKNTNLPQLLSPPPAAVPTAAPPAILQEETIIQKLKRNQIWKTPAMVMNYN